MGKSIGKLSKKKKGDTCYIQYQLEQREQINFKELIILINPGMNAILPMKAVKKNSTYLLECQVYEEKTLGEYVGKEIGLREFFAIINNITNVLKGLYTMQMEHRYLVLEEDSVFIDCTTKAMKFVYLPILHSTRRYEISKFLSQLFYHIKTTSSPLSGICNQYIEFLEAGKAFHTKLFLEFHEQMKLYYVEKLPVVSPSERIQPSNMELEQFRSLPNTYFQKKLEPCLFRKSNEEYIYLKKEQFLLGKNYNEVDYIIEGNELISGVHAEIINRENTFFVYDHFSTNGTYLNEHSIQSGQEVELQPGIELRLANEVFVLCIKEGE